MVLSVVQEGPMGFVDVAVRGKAKSGSVDSRWYRDGRSWPGAGQFQTCWVCQTERRTSSSNKKPNKYLRKTTQTLQMVKFILACL